MSHHIHSWVGSSDQQDFPNLFLRIFYGLSLSRSCLTWPEYHQWFSGFDIDIYKLNNATQQLELIDQSDLETMFEAPRPESVIAAAANDTSGEIFLVNHDMMVCIGFLEPIQDIFLACNIVLSTAVFLYL